MQDMTIQDEARQDNERHNNTNKMRQGITGHGNA